MKIIILLSAVLAISAAAILPLHPIQTQYHAQSPYGYDFGFDTPLISRKEASGPGNEVIGTYSYYDADGKLQTVNYEAGPLTGFHVKATNLPKAPTVEAVALPVPVEDTLEVSEARKAHLEAIEAAKSGKVLEVPVLTPVFTDEVAKAREEHLKAIEMAKSGIIIEPKSDLPKPVEETEEVKAEREKHLKIWEAFRDGKVLVPAPVEDTLDVKLAKYENALLHQRALINRQLVPEVYDYRPIEMQRAFPIVNPIPDYYNHVGLYNSRFLPEILY